jgi:hypothetical protein
MNLFGLEPDEFRDVLLSIGSNRGRRPLSPIEVAILLKKILDIGTSMKDCAAAVHLEGPTMVSRFTRLLNLHPDVQHLVDWGQSGATVSFSSATEIAKLPQEDHVPAANAIVENQLTGGEIKQIVQRVVRSHRKLADAVDEIVQLRPMIERHHLYIGAVIDDGLRTVLASRTQEQRDQLLQEFLREHFPTASTLSVRLGRTRFTISSKDDLSKLTGGSNDDLEKIINDSLGKKVGKG